MNKKKYLSIFRRKTNQSRKLPMSRFQKFRSRSLRQKSVPRSTKLLRPKSDPRPTKLLRPKSGRKPTKLFQPKSDPNRKRKKPGRLWQMHRSSIRPRRKKDSSLPNWKRFLLFIQKNVFSISFHLNLRKELVYGILN